MWYQLQALPSNRHISREICSLVDWRRSLQSFPMKPRYKGSSARILRKLLHLRITRVSLLFSSFSEIFAVNTMLSDVLVNTPAVRLFPLLDAGAVINHFACGRTGILASM